jgi:hypothetical protein
MLCRSIYFAARRRVQIVCAHEIKSAGWIVGIFERFNDDKSAGVAHP